MKKNILTSQPFCGDIDIHLCMGCGICAGICPRNALTMKLEERIGVYKPTYIPDRCNECGLCREVCPGYTTDLEDACQQLWGIKPRNKRLGHYQAAYAAYSRNDAIRYNASSGGMVTSLLVHALNKGNITGALVTRMSQDVPWMTEAFIAKRPEEIMSATGSKYCPVSIHEALKEIMHTEGKYAVVGLPCHIYGLRKAQVLFKPLRERVVVTFGLFCAGGRSYKGTEAFLSQSGLRLNDVSAIRYRGSGWPGETNVVDRTGRSIRCSYEVAYPFMCINDVYRCTVCPDKTSELADISFGDLWLADEKPHMGAGKSVCLVRSEIGAAILKQAIEGGSVTARTLDQSFVIAAVDKENKKKLAAARLTIARWFGRPVPMITNTAQKLYSITDLVRGLQYFILQRICRHESLQRAYFFIRPKYRQLRMKIGSHQAPD